MVNSMSKNIVAATPLNGASWQSEQLSIAEMPMQALVRLQGEGNNTAFLKGAAEKLGVALPTIPCTSEVSGKRKALWMNPNEWIIVAPIEEEEELTVAAQAAGEGFVSMVTVNTDNRIGISIKGVAAGDFLSKGCSLDLHPSAFTVGKTTVTRHAHLPVVLNKVAEDSFEIYIDCAQSRHYWHGLEDAAEEFK